LTSLAADPQRDPTFSMALTTSIPSTTCPNTTYTESEGSSITRSTRVALRDPRGVSIISLTNPPPEHRTIFSRASTESQATEPSRRWQPPRVTSTTGLQLDHLVPLDAISQCNRTRIAHSLDQMNTTSMSELEGSQAPPHKVTKALVCSATSPRPAKRAIYKLNTKKSRYPFTEHSAH
jgi:hypothetical protein